LELVEPFVGPTCAVRDDRCCARRPDARQQLQPVHGRSVHVDRDPAAFNERTHRGRFGMLLDDRTH